jgi:EAL domain-containing protein (putative c-di-GMP-specific phosphodiesterase class I)
VNAKSLPINRVGSGASWFARRWRQSLVLSVTVMGVVAVAVLGLVAQAVVADQIRGDAISRAQATAELLARSMFAPRLPARGESLPPRARHELDAQLAAVRNVQPGTDVVLRDNGGRVLYASEAAIGGGATVDRLGTRVEGQGPGRRLRSVLPVRARGESGTAAYLEFQTPYAPVASDIKRRTHRLNVVLAVAAFALYLFMLPTLIRAGRAVRAQYDPRRVQIARALRKAIKHDELSLAFQPIVHSDTRELHSVEALVRWTDPRQGPVPPDAFIPVVESTPAIWDLTECIFDLAFRQCAQWCEEGRRIPIAVNVSGAVLLDKRLIPLIRRLSKDYRVPPRMIQLEITEGALVQDPREATGMLRRIAEMGLSVIAIDDFGTGYSSLARLHELPLDTLKIDQSFVKRMGAAGDAAVVRSVIELAHALGMDVIAEGVEDDATAARLRDMGAEHLQGYYISKPIPAGDLVAWLWQAEPVTS